MPRTLEQAIERGCGCYYTPRKRTRPEYSTWQNIKARCSPNTTSPSLRKYYYEMGVRVCDRWANSFQDFLADVGPKPGPEYSIDRYPDPWGNYEPGNVRWATAEQQANNRRNSRRKIISE